MKKIKLITALLLVAISLSCEKDGGDSVVNALEGGTPNITKTVGTDQGINVLALNTGGDINIGLNIGLGFGDIVSMDVIGFYTKGTTTERGVLKKGITTFPSQVNIKKADLFNAFNVLNSASDVALTDKLLITTELTLRNGTVIKMYRNDGVRNFGADISNSLLFKPSQEYIVSCPLTDASLFNGNYKVVEDGWADYGVGDVVPVVYNSANGLFKFRILNTNNPALVNASTTYYEVTVNPTNFAVTVKSNITLNYGGTPQYTTDLTGTGSVASCTGDINLLLTFTGSGQSAPYKFNLVKM
jgi:hypothetical protein